MSRSTDETGRDGELRPAIDGGKRSDAYARENTAWVEEYGADPQGTTACLLTPAGSGAIGVIRVRGRDAVALVDACCRGPSASGFPIRAPREERGNLTIPTRLDGKAERGPTPVPDQQGTKVSFRTAFDADEPLDDVLISVVPDSGVPAVDLCAHGGIRVLERILQSLVRHGAQISNRRLANFPAFESTTGIEHEALCALTRARTELAVQFLARQRIILPRTLLELAKKADNEVAAVRARLDRMRSLYPAARLLLEGATVAITGPPNSGKSTLFNALVGRTAALASPIAGTTRDWVTAEINLNGIPVTLVDTAGERSVDDALETEAIRRGRARAFAADLCLVLHDPGCSTTAKTVETDAQPRGQNGLHPPQLTVYTKADLFSSFSPDADFAKAGTGATCHLVSAADGTGLDTLNRAVLRELGWDDAVRKETAFFSERQVRHVSNVLVSPDNLLAGSIRALVDSGADNRVA